MSSHEVAGLQLVSATQTAESRPVSRVALDGHPPVKEFLGQPAQSNHIVQFYEEDGVLCDHIAHFLGAGFAAGDFLVVIATEAHRKALSHRLKLNGFDVEGACATGQLMLFDAHEMLARFMVNGRPDGERFDALIGGVIEEGKASRGEVRVRAYGEMVDVLWREGNAEAAIELEGLWNDLGKSHSFSLLCAYVMGNFYKSADGKHFREICQAHTHVIPTESYSAIEDPDGRLREISLLQQRARSLESEIEHRKQLENTLREVLARETAAREEAERNVHYNEMFAAVLGHDLRNPLSAITTGAHYITRINSGEKATKAATRILASAERMARMIDQLLDFTRIRVGGGFPLNPTRFDLADVCLKVKDELDAAHPLSTILLETERAAVGAWDYDRLLQVFSNLVGNALHHGSLGSPVLIRIDGTRTDVTACVHNAGVVSPEVLPVLFEPFRGSKQEKTSGLGLGLYITRQIVLAHGGSIEVVSSAEEGTTFRVQLPRVAVSACPLAP